MRYFHFVLTASVLMLSGPARADLPPPDTLGCLMAREGDACDPDVQQSDGGTKSGTCRKATCSRPDYAGWNRDASAAPPTMQYDCLKCLVGAADGGADAGGGDAAGSPSKSGSSGCTVSGAETAFGPWLLAGAFAAAIWFVRRRR
jgi:MYXO-CTERM domain-containing protein